MCGRVVYTYDEIRLPVSVSSQCRAVAGVTGMSLSVADRSQSSEAELAILPSSGASLFLSVSLVSFVVCSLPFSFVHSK